MPNFALENKYLRQKKYVVGIDEAGRGALAGPVVSAALFFKKKVEIPYLNDSKQLSRKKRDEIFTIINDNQFIEYSIGVIDSQFIDNHNILIATMKAMQIALINLSVQPKETFYLIDGNYFNINQDLDYKTVIKGDSLSSSIAAASIVAKTLRDSIMEDYSSIYPEFSFEKHKGYGTKSHFINLENFGPTAIHRLTFLKNLGKSQSKLF